MFDSGKFEIGLGAGAATKGRLGFDDLHLQTRTGTDYGGRESVGSAADDGDVHLLITADYADDGDPAAPGSAALAIPATLAA